MFCPNCGSEAEHLDRYCRSCGHALAAPVRLPEPGPVLTFDHEAYLLASFWRRLAASLIDGLIIYVAWGAAFALVLMIRGDLDESDPDALVENSLSTMYLVQTFAIVALVVAFCAFDCIGWSPGRLAVGIRIVRWDGGRPGLRHGPIRYAARTLSALVIYLGFFWVLWDRYRQGWHDKMAQTYVVRVPSGFVFRRPVTDASEVSPPAYDPGPRGPLRRGLVSATIAAFVILLMTGCSVAVNHSFRAASLDGWDRAALERVSFAPLHPVPGARELAVMPPVIPSEPVGCEGPAHRVCFLVIGAGPGVPVDQLAAYYEHRLGIQTGILPAVQLRATSLDSIVGDQERKQLVAAGLIRLAQEAYPSLPADPGITLIVLTGHDLMLDSEPTWRFAFGAVGERPSGGGIAVVSDARMNPLAHGAPANPDRLERRLHAMIGKYVGLLHYGLPRSNDPTSPLTISIRSAADLDRMRPLEELLSEQGLIGPATARAR